MQELRAAHAAKADWREAAATCLAALGEVPRDALGFLYVTDHLAGELPAILAQAVTQLFPGVKLAIGPPIENGFYYDFHRDVPFSEEDLARLEARMRDLAKADYPIVREERSRAEAIRYSTAGTPSWHSSRRFLRNRLNIRFETGVETGAKIREAPPVSMPSSQVRRVPPAIGSSR